MATLAVINFRHPAIDNLGTGMATTQKTKALQNNIFILRNTKEILHVTSSTFDYFNNTFFD